MASFVLLLALLISPLAFGAESLDGVSQVVDADTSADKPIIKPLSQIPRPAPAPDKSAIDADVKIEIRRYFDELYREFLNERIKIVDWWLAGMAIGIGVFSIIAAVAGYISFKRLDKIAKDAEGLIEELKETRDEHRKRLEELDAQVAVNNPNEAARTATSVQRDPTSSEIDRARAAAIELQGQGKFEEAIEKWRSIANIVEDRQLQARAWFSIGYLNGERDNFETAISAYTEALASNPGLAEAYNNRGNAKNLLGDYQAAVADYDRAIVLNPNYAEFYNNRGNVKNRLGDYQAAVADLDRAIVLNPDLAEAYHNRGNAKGGLGDYQAAVADLDSAIELNPADAEFYSDRGNAKDGLGDHQAAIADYDRAIVLNPDYAEAYNNRGNAKNDLGDYQAAVADLDRAIKLNSDLAEAYHNRGNARVGLGDQQAAIADYDRAIELNSAYAEFYSDRGNAQRDLGNIAKAREDYQAAIESAEEAGNEDLAAMVKDNLSRLDNDEEP